MRLELLETTAALCVVGTSLLALPSCAPAQRQPDGEPLAGQVMVDPDNGSYLVYNRDRDGDGALDPAFLIGPGDPEGFLYLGERGSDGTREGGPQLDIIRRMAENGGNALYIQVVRSHGGDGESDHNPWRDPGDPASGLDPDIVRQWTGWFDRMEAAGIVVFLFVYDDGAHPFGNGCTATVGADERAFIGALVDALESYPNLIWVTQEEFKFVGHAGRRRPCDDARVRKMEILAGLLKEFDDHDHLVGVHHNIGDAMAFADHPGVDIYMQQAPVRVGRGRGTLAALHRAGRPGTGFDPEHRYVYVMAEAYNWHPALLDERDRATLRRSYYASAMAAGYVLVLGMFGVDEGGPPTDAMLQDMRRMAEFFESTAFNEMAPADALAFADTRWVMADPEGESYILYAPGGGELTGRQDPTGMDGPADGEDRGAEGELGVRDLEPGRYTLRWFDPVSGRTIVQQRRVAAPGAGAPARGAAFEPPADISSEVVLYLRRTSELNAAD